MATPIERATKRPSWCCQKCGENIGWLGRFGFASCFHKCREWFVIDDSRKNGVFATEEMRKIQGYIPRDVAEVLLGRNLDGHQWFTKEESEKFRSHPEWRTTQP